MWIVLLLRHQGQRESRTLVPDVWFIIMKLCACVLSVFHKRHHLSGLYGNNVLYKFHELWNKLPLFCDIKKPSSLAYGQILFDFIKIDVDLGLLL